MNTYTKKEKNGYLLGMMGQNMLYGVIFTGLAYYYQSVIFLPAIAISVIFAAGKIFDAVKDPIMGTFIDKTKSKWGKCRPYLIFSPIVLGVLIIVAYFNGDYSSSNSNLTNIMIITWAAVSYTLLGLAYSAGDLPLWTLPSLMSENEKDRNKLMAISRIYGAIGNALVLIILIPLSQYLGKISAGSIGDSNLALKYNFIAVSIVLTVIGTVFFLFAGLNTKERVKSLKEKSSSLKENLKIMWSCKPFRKLTVSSVLRGMNSVSGLVIMTLFSYYYGNNGQSSYLLYFLFINGGAMAGQIIITFLMPKIIEKGNRKKLYFLSTFIYGISLVLIFLLYLLVPEELDKLPYMIIFFILMFVGCGVASGALLVLHSVMTADTVDYYEYETNYRPDGVFFSGMTMVYKLSAGLSAIVMGIVYTIYGFSGDNVKAVNEALYNGAIFKSDPAFYDYRMAMFLLFALIPAIFILLSAIPMIKYNLSGDERKKVERELEQRRKERQEEPQ